MELALIIIESYIQAKKVHFFFKIEFFVVGIKIDRAEGTPYFSDLLENSCPLKS